MEIRKVDRKVRQKVCRLDSRKVKAMADLKEYLMVPLTALKKANSKVRLTEYHSEEKMAAKKVDLKECLMECLKVSKRVDLKACSRAKNLVLKKVDLKVVKRAKAMVLNLEVEKAHSMDLNLVPWMVRYLAKEKAHSTEPNLAKARVHLMEVN